MPFEPGDPAAYFEVYECGRHRVTARSGETQWVAIFRAPPGTSGGEDWGAARRAIREAVPDTLFGFPFDDIDQDGGEGPVWLATVTYGVPPGNQPSSGEAPYGFGTPATAFPPPAEGGGVPPAPPPPPPAPTEGTPLGPEWSFDTTGATVKITQSLGTAFIGQREDTFAPVPDYRRAIGVTKEGVEGTDVVTRRLEFSYQVRASYVTLGYVQQAYRLTGTVNHAAFLGFDKGELLFLGASGQSQTPTDGKTPVWTLSFKFAASPTQGDPFSVSPDPLDYFVVAGKPMSEGADPARVAVPGKEGHDYVWVSYGQRTEGGRTLTVPVNAYIEKVYPYGDLTTLELFS